MPTGKRKKPQQTQTKSNQELLQDVKNILEQETIDKLFKILPQINKNLATTFIYKVDKAEFQLRVEIVKLLKKALLARDKFSSLNPQQLQDLDKFTYSICKSTAQTTKFQDELANYLERYFIGLDCYISITKEGVFYHKNPGSNTYSKIPAGTADAVITVTDKEGNIVAQYIFECDGSSHRDVEKDKKRDDYYTTHATEYLCLQHGNTDFADYLKNKEAELKKIISEVNALPLVADERSERRKKDVANRKEPRVSKDSNSFKPLQKTQDESPLEEWEGKEEGKEEGKGVLDASTDQSKSSGIKSKKTQAEEDEEAIEKALEEAQKETDQKTKIINDFLNLAVEGGFDEFLKQMLAISQKAPTTQLDEYLLEKAKPYVVTLLKTGYENPVLLDEGLFSKLGNITTTKQNESPITDHDKISIAHNIAKLCRTYKEPNDFWQLTEKILGADFTKSVSKYCKYFLQHCCESDYSELFNHLLEKKECGIKDKELLLDLLNHCYAFGSSLQIVKIILAKIEELKITTKDPILSRSARISAIYNNSSFLQLLLTEPEFESDLPNILNVKEADNDFTPLLYALQYGHTDIVRLLLDQPKVDVNAETKDGFTALKLAIQYGHIEIVELLLKHKDIEVNKRGKETSRNTPLISAVEKGNQKIVELLLEQPGIDINAQTKDGSTALMMAVYDGNKDIAGLLLEKSEVKVNLQRETDGYNALMMAAHHGRLDIVGLLLKRPDIDVNLQDKDDLTALMIAIYAGNKDIVELLLQHKNIDVNLQGPGDCTALIFAVEANNLEMVKLLLKQPGIDINAQKKDGSTALMMAASLGYIKIVELLLQHENIDVNLQGPGDKTAQQCTKNKTIKKLIEKHKKPDTTLHQGLTSLTKITNTAEIVK